MKALCDGDGIGGGEGEGGGEGAGAKKRRQVPVRLTIETERLGRKPEVLQSLGIH
jgi:hypothetical protein